jgi:hypothetical protein
MIGLTFISSLNISHQEQRPTAYYVNLAAEKSALRFTLQIKQL